MIRINLLGIAKPKKGKRGGGGGGMSMPSMSGGGEGPGAIPFLIIGIVLGMGAAGTLWYVADREATELAKQLTLANNEGARLQSVKVKYEQRKKEADAFERRVKVIDQLRADQSGPVTLLNTVGEMVNSTDAVWLNDMSETGNAINIKGVALTTNAVANLITNLKRSGYFKAVEIQMAAQDPAVKDMQAFNFVLICEKQPKATTT